jgi:hypothetical protein
VSRPVTARLDPASAVAAAARNNAEWCDTVCRTHGLPGAFSPHAWTSRRRTPPLYPDAVTLSREASAGGVVEAIDTASPGASVKDSFARLDLTAHGFDVLFEAEWLYREAGLPASSMGRWEAVRDPVALERWEAAWAGGDGPRGLFRGELLDDPNVVVLSLERNGRIATGAVLYRTPSVVGVSNLFAVDGDLDAAWAGCLATIAALAPGLPVVGYDSGEALEAARREGFASTGALRVWMQADSHSEAEGACVP